MKRMSFLFAAAVLVLGAPDAGADRGPRHKHGGHYGHGGHYYGHHRHHHGSVYRHWWGGYSPWYYAPAAPLYLSYPAWAPRFYSAVPAYPAPVYPEPVYERPPAYSADELRPRRERSYAKVDPAPAKPPQERIERITLSATELFEFDKATLFLPQPKLDQVADAMLRDSRIEKLTITGYTDRLGSDAYNLKLSQQRAEAVKAYLVAKGVAAHRLVAVGKGEAQPVVQCNDKDQRELIRCLEPNRRVEVEQITIERKVVESGKR